jgi:oligoribonuclease NrnB/cAMP/cGMP phosphodiesterase (DHH superfamily)
MDGTLDQATQELEEEEVSNEAKTPYCVYHRADLDGICSAAIVRREVPGVVLIPADYGDKLEAVEEIPDGATVYIVDFCLEPFDRMIALAKRCTVVWLDHHISAIKKAEKAGLGALVSGTQDELLAGCELTWDWFRPEQPRPVSVCLLGRWDVWDESHPKWAILKSFQYGARARNLRPDSEEWGGLLGSVWSGDAIIALGNTILAYQASQDAAAAQDGAFLVAFEGLAFVALNTPRRGSDQFASVYDPVHHDAMLAFCLLSSGRWRVNMYAEKPCDLSIIAVRHGGGGHKRAAGFVCNALPFPSREQTQGV